MGIFSEDSIGSPLNLGYTSHPPRESQTPSSGSLEGNHSPLTMFCITWSLCSTPTLAHWPVASKYWVRMITGVNLLSVCSGQPVGSLSSSCVSLLVRLPKMVSPRMSPVRWAGSPWEWPKPSWLSDHSHMGTLSPSCCCAQPGLGGASSLLPLYIPSGASCALSTLDADKHFCLCIGHLVRKVCSWHQLHLGLT